MRNTVRGCVDVGHRLIAACVKRANTADTWNPTVARNMAHRNVHVIPHGDMWQVIREGPH